MFLSNIECPCGLNFNSNHNSSDFEVCIECDDFECCIGCGNTGITEYDIEMFIKKLKSLREEDIKLV